MALSSDVVPPSTPTEVLRKIRKKGDVTIEFALWQPQNPSGQCAIALHGFSRPLEDMLGVRPLLGRKGVSLVMPHLAAHGRSSGHQQAPGVPPIGSAALEGIVDGGRAGHLAMARSWGTASGGTAGADLVVARQPQRFTTRAPAWPPTGWSKIPGYRFSVETPALGRAWLQSKRPATREAMVRFLLTWLRARRQWLPEHFYQFSLVPPRNAQEMWAMVIDCWCSLRKFWPPGRRRLVAISKAHPGILEAHFGERDKVIKPTNAKGLRGVCTVKFHPCGHGLLRPDIIERIASPS